MPLESSVESQRPVAPIHRGRAWGPLLLLCAAIALSSGARAGRLEAPAAETVAGGADRTAPLPRGQVLRRALLADTSQHYLLYVPGRGGQGAPILVATHGISRNVEEHAALFAPCAEKKGAVLIAPCFPRDEFEDYQRLGREGRGRRADVALDAIVREAASLTGAVATKIHVFGFSGGAQFAHRYVMAHPDRVASAAVAAAGWYTFPDSATPYPYGLGPGDEPSSVRFDPDRFLRVPITVFVGSADTGSKNVRRNPAVDRQQGVTRLERAQRWTAAMRRAAESRGLEPLVTCELVPGVGHSFRQFMQEGDAGDRVFAALFERRQAAAAAGGRP
jgi:poly(3-hydroxybutyrate) depolymerase